MKSIFTFLLLTALVQVSKADCLSTIKETTLTAVAAEAGQVVDDLLLVRAEMGMWTEAVANNAGTAEVSILVGGQISYFQVHVKQIGSTENCEVISMEKMSGDTVAEIVKQAESYRVAIGHALHISESDSEWMPFYSPLHLSGFKKSELREALKTSKPIEIYTIKRSKEFLAGYASRENESAVERAQYAKLTKLLKKDFKQFRMIKVGKPDSGQMDLYILGITEDGQLVGLHTISIET